MTIKVIRGNPTPEELAAALAVVRARAAAIAAAVPEHAPGTKDAWSDPSRIARQRLPQPSQSAWTRTYWPA
ncbi:MAG: acyl-CoA carboxylase subunit epsilon [Streptomyces sp.]|uniref:acyl-CoA carboxylase epsilon subunit n=1 Tax=Streptomyces sp. TaxID=1931 RepID=UPI0025F531CA|nr:acyl-CoA carboxylase epsilon subunit [Streptomyces sp.]MBW8792354.1 acyl-CoA carboxylase subunit epsilon [Streptomyces sp.]